MGATHIRVRSLAFKRRLLKWFRREGRALPWRQTRDPYRVLISEFMLQQTQVSRVLGYYRRFLRRYPNLLSLAKASPSDVRREWEGLGYYRRAANLHAAARLIVREHRSRVPDDPHHLAKLPGIGAYTAGAVAAFAYERRVPAIDTNVNRVLRRVFCPRAGTTPATSRRVHDLAVQILPTKRPVAWEFNQALMDLGAMICTARAPDCPACPVQKVCRTGSRA